MLMKQPLLSLTARLVPDLLERERKDTGSFRMLETITMRKISRISSAVQRTEENIQGQINSHAHLGVVDPVL